MKTTMVQSRAICLVGLIAAAAMGLARGCPFLSEDGAFNSTMPMPANHDSFMFAEEVGRGGVVAGSPYVQKGQQSRARSDTSIQQESKRRKLQRRKRKPSKKKKKGGRGGRNNNGANRPNSRPRPQQPRPQQPRPQQQNNNNNNNRGTCMTVSTYNAIDEDIALLKNSMRNNAREASHFLGGVVRLAAHDFMDYDRRSANQMGMDGCYDPSHSSNDGLETIWCNNCPLKKLYDQKYSNLGRADFWVAAANAVIRLTSVNNSLDLRGEFQWGRRDRSICRGAGERLPQASDCGQVEDVFLRRMGLEWKDAVALLGAHTLGRGDARFSGHHGTWVDNDRDAQVFDKKYYEEMFTHSWRPRNMGRGKQDWTTGRGGGNDRVMLNTDMCLVFDIDQSIRQRIPCCSRTNGRYPDGMSQCVDRDAARRQCPTYPRFDSRREASDAVRDMLGGSLSSNNNAPFYIAFAKAWRKATTAGQDNLRPLAETC